jgi:hypothetical protein
MKAAIAANDNELSPEVESLRDAIDTLEENADMLTTADFDEVEKLYKKLQDMVEA